MTVAFNAEQVGFTSPVAPHFGGRALTLFLLPPKTDLLHDRLLYQTPLEIRGLNAEEDIMKRIALAAILTAALAGPALAGGCPVLMKEVDAALAKGTSLSAAQMTEVTALRAKGEAEHNKGGSHAAAVATLKKAKEILGIM